MSPADRTGIKSMTEGQRREMEDRQSEDVFSGEDPTDNRRVYVVQGSWSTQARAKWWDVEPYPESGPVGLTEALRHAGELRDANPDITFRLVPRGWKGDPPPVKNRQGVGR